MNAFRLLLMGLAALFCVGCQGIGGSISQIPAGSTCTIVTGVSSVSGTCSEPTPPSVSSCTGNSGASCMVSPQPTSASPQPSVGSPSPTIIPSVVPIVTAMPSPASSVAVAFYSYADNNPPNSLAIAYQNKYYPEAIHNAAGGLGTYADPITLSSDKAEFPIGTRFYIPSLQKYFVMEDDCPDCDQAWMARQARGVQIWIGGNASSPAGMLSACENSLQMLLKKNGLVVQVNPPMGLPVIATPLFDITTRDCFD